jgi:membrane-bound lytic murein transglycosylase D
MTFLRLLVLAFLFQTTSCAVKGNSALRKNDDSVDVAYDGDEDKDVDAEDVEITPESLGDVDVSPETSVKEKDADQQSMTTFPLVYNEFVQMWINYFTGRGRGTFEKWLSRSTRYIPLMKQVLKEEGVPEDLIYLSMIESGFNPKAYSRAKAVGPWQFMEATGKRYGLKVDFWIDERKDIVESTHAAAQYLKELHQIFGSWYLAAAGYNAGEGKVLNAIRREKNRNFWQLSHEKKNFRAETTNYVPKIIAAAILAKDPHKYGFSKDLEFEKPLVWESVRIPGGVDLRAVAQVTGADPEVLQLLNAELRAGITPPDSKDGYLFRVPPEKKELLISKISELSRIQVASFISHKIGRGENLGYIARRYKTSTTTLLKLNNIRNPKALRVGQVIKVPLPYSKLGRGPTSVQKSEKIERISKKVDAPRNREVASSQDFVQHRVKRGESLIRLAKKYNVKMSEILKVNNLKSRELRIGQSLKIPDNVN